jgi:hypothetical protein
MVGADAFWDAVDVWIEVVEAMAGSVWRERIEYSLGLKWLFALFHAFGKGVFRGFHLANVRGKRRLWGLECQFAFDFDGFDLFVLGPLDPSAVCGGAPSLLLFLLFGGVVAHCSDGTWW